MPRTSKDRPSQSTESVTYPEGKFFHSLVGRRYRISVYTESSLTPQQLETLRSWVSLGIDVISMPGGSIYVTLQSHYPTKAGL